MMTTDQFDYDGVIRQLQLENEGLRFEIFKVRASKDHPFHEMRWEEVGRWMQEQYVPIALVMMALGLFFSIVTTFRGRKQHER